MDDVQAERAAIEAAIGGQTLGHVLARNADRMGYLPALSWEEDGSWRTISWREYRERVAAAALGLRSLGVRRGDFVAIMTHNRPEHVIADLAAVHLGATAVSLYNTLAPEQIRYIAAHCGAKVAVVEGREFLERWEKVRPDLPALERMVVLDGGEDLAGDEWMTAWSSVMTVGEAALAAPGGREAFEAEWRTSKPEDPVTLIYTSGTTGNPKGVVITHRNVLWTADSLDRTGDHEMAQTAVSYLPLAHVAERMATHYLGTYKAAHIHFCPDVLRVFEVVPRVRPEAFFGVPRVWEKLQAGIVAKLGEEPNARKRAIALKAVEVGKRAALLEAKGKPVPLGVRTQRALFERLVYAKIRAAVGLDRCRVPVSGAAPISEETLAFFWGIGLKLYEVYGMTEDSGPATINTQLHAKLGTAGRRLPGVEVRLAEDGEVLVRGGNVAPGYFRDEERTAETFDAEGWLHTGDIGRIDTDGYVTIVDRKKELIITAGGKNISPANLENLLKQHPLIGQACVVGDRRAYVCALIVLDGETAPTWAGSNGLAFTDLAAFARQQRVSAEIQKAVDDANQHVSNVERIKRFAILPTEWTVDGEELTPTLKLKRRVVLAKYAEDIERLYAEA
jgi:long-chain acyl-CoA synthetase